MHLLIDKITRLEIDWNRRPLTEADFYRLCRKHKVTVEEIPLRVSGFYYSVLGRHCIAIDSRLSRQKKLLVMFHEFAHFLLHATEGGATANYHGVGKRTRKELEADVFALCAVIPRTWINSARFCEYVDENAIEAEMVSERLRIFERFGV